MENSSFESKKEREELVTISVQSTGTKKREAALYAQEYAKLEIVGVQYLAFRDVEALVKKYVVGKEALDYGCGCGKSTRHLKNLGLRVTGVDISADMIEGALKSDPRGSYKLITSANVPALEATYDFVFSSWVMLEVSTKSELVAIAREISRVLKPDGVFVMIVCNENSYNNDWSTENTEFEENRELRSGCRVKTLFKAVNLIIHDYFWTARDYREMIEGSGMRLLETHEPLGRETDGIEWRLERVLAPVTVYVARKS